MSLLHLQRKSNNTEINIIKDKYKNLQKINSNVNVDNNNINNINNNIKHLKFNSFNKKTIFFNKLNTTNEQSIIQSVVQSNNNTQFIPLSTPSNNNNISSNDLITYGKYILDSILTSNDIDKLTSLLEELRSDTYCHKSIQSSKPLSLLFLYGKSKYNKVASNTTYNKINTFDTTTSINITGNMQVSNQINDILKYRDSKRRYNLMNYKPSNPDSIVPITNNICDIVNMNDCVVSQIKILDSNNVIDKIIFFNYNKKYNHFDYPLKLICLNNTNICPTVRQAEVSNQKKIVNKYQKTIIKQSNKVNTKSSQSNKVHNTKSIQSNKVHNTKSIQSNKVHNTKSIQSSQSNKVNNTKSSQLNKVNTKSSQSNKVNNTNKIDIIKKNSQIISKNVNKLKKVQILETASVDGNIESQNIIKKNIMLRMGTKNGSKIIFNNTNINKKASSNNSQKDIEIETLSDKMFELQLNNIKSIFKTYDSNLNKYIKDNIIQII